MNRRPRAYREAELSINQRLFPDARDRCAAVEIFALSSFLPYAHPHRASVQRGGPRTFLGSAGYWSGGFCSHSSPPPTYHAAGRRGFDNASQPPPASPQKRIPSGLRCSAEAPARFLAQPDIGAGASAVTLARPQRTTQPGGAGSSPPIAPPSSRHQTRIWRSSVSAVCSSQRGREDWSPLCALSAGFLWRWTSYGSGCGACASYTRPLRAAEAGALSARSMPRPLVVGCALWRWAPCGGGRPMETDILWRLCVPSARCGGGGALFRALCAPSGSGCALWRRVSYGDRLPMEVDALWRRVRRLRVLYSSPARCGGGCTLCVLYARPLVVGCGGGRPMEAGAAPARPIRVICALRRRVHPLRALCAPRWWWVVPCGGGRPVEAGAPPAHLIRVLCAPQRRTRPLRSLRASSGGGSGGGRPRSTGPE